MYKKGLVNSNSRIISTDEDPSLRIESSAIINLRGVSTKLNKYNIVLNRGRYKQLRVVDKRFHRAGSWCQRQIINAYIKQYRANNGALWDSMGNRKWFRQRGANTHNLGSAREITLEPLNSSFRQAQCTWFGQ